jgi:hypothetical protein
MRVEYWPTKAAEYFPDLEGVITREQPLPSPMGLWIDLYFELAKAYDVSPINEDLIRRIYDFAGWCLSQPNTTDAATDISSAVAVAFIEDLPLNRRISEDLHRWMSVDTFKDLENLFRYHLSEDACRTFFSEFVSRRQPSDPPPGL